MLSSASQAKTLKFLLDENVKKELLTFLKDEGYGVTVKSKGLSNGRLAEFSKIERRIFVTNDTDFTDSLLSSKDEIFSIVLLRIPQSATPEPLIKSFSKLLKSKTSPEEFEGNLIKLYEDTFEIDSLG